MSQLNSHIEYDKDGYAIGFVGKDAVLYYRALALRSALGLLAHGIIPSRGLTKTPALKLASGITGKPYKRTEVEKARADLLLWANTMKAALPQVVK